MVMGSDVNDDPPLRPDVYASNLMQRLSQDSLPELCLEGQKQNQKP